MADPYDIPSDILRRSATLADDVREGRLTPTEALHMLEDIGPLLERLTTDTPDIARAEYHAESEAELEALERDIAQRPTHSPPTRAQRQHGPRLKTVLDQAKKAGAASVTTPEGFTYGLAGGIQAEQISDNPFHREEARLRQLKREDGE